MGGCGGPQTIGKTLSTDFEIGPHPPPPNILSLLFVFFLFFKTCHWYFCLLFLAPQVLSSQYSPQSNRYPLHSTPVQSSPPLPLFAPQPIKPYSSVSSISSERSLCGGATSISDGIFFSKLAWYKTELRNMSLFPLKLEYLCFNPRLSFIVSLDFSLKFKFSFSECGTGATEIFGGLKADRQDLCGAINWSHIIAQFHSANNPEFITFNILCKCQ